MPTDDSQLLASYALDPTGGAFQRLVERHIDFVYAAALRQTADPHLAEDIAQAVFLLFSQRAGRLKTGTVVKGWLFKATRYVVANTRRIEARRKLHEREAAAMRSEIVREDHWPSIAPRLDDALAGLSEKDRQVLLLRFFDDLPLAALGQTLGISEYAAQKRVARALERLRHSLVGRGAAVTGASLGGVLQASAAQAAPIHLAKATIDLALNGASDATHSSSASSLAKGAAKMMTHAKAKLLAISCAIAGVSIGTAVVLANSQPRLIPPPPAQPLVVAMTDAADTPTAPDEDYNACCQVLNSIVDGYDRNDPAAVQALFYFKPGTDPNTIDVMNHILEMDVAAYRLVNSAVSRFGMHGTMLVTGIGTDAAMILEVLSRISPQNAQVTGDSLSITPPATTGSNGWPKPIYFVRAQGTWKLDAGRTFRIAIRAARRQPVAGERSDQVFAAIVNLISGEFEAIADDIDKGAIPDEAEAQRRVYATMGDVKSQFRDFGCGTNPR